MAPHLTFSTHIAKDQENDGLRYLDVFATASNGGKKPIKLKSISFRIQTIKPNQSNVKPLARDAQYKMRLEELLGNLNQGFVTPYLKTGQDVEEHEKEINEKRKEFEAEQAQLSKDLLDHLSQYSVPTVLHINPMESTQIEWMTLSGSESIREFSETLAPGQSFSTHFRVAFAFPESIPGEPSSIYIESELNVEGENDKRFFQVIPPSPTGRAAWNPSQDQELPPVVGCAAPPSTLDD